MMQALKKFLWGLCAPLLAVIYMFSLKYFESEIPSQYKEPASMVLWVLLLLGVLWVMLYPAIGYSKNKK